MSELASVPLSATRTLMRAFFVWNLFRPIHALNRANLCVVLLYGLRPLGICDVLIALSTVLRIN